MKGLNFLNRVTFLDLRMAPHHTQIYKAEKGYRCPGARSRKFALHHGSGARSNVYADLQRMILSSSLSHGGRARSRKLGPGC